MRRKPGYRWHLREIMAHKGMFSTTDLVPLLKQRGIELSPVQVYRLVAQTPERLNLKTLAALCDILSCTPNDLIEPTVEERLKAVRSSGAGKDGGDRPRPRRAEITSKKR